MTSQQRKDKRKRDDSDHDYKVTKRTSIKDFATTKMVADQMHEQLGMALVEDHGQHWDQAQHDEEQVVGSEIPVGFEGEDEMLVWDCHKCHAKFEDPNGERKLNSHLAEGEAEAEDIFFRCKCGKYVDCTPSGVKDHMRADKGCTKGKKYFKDQKMRWNDHLHIRMQCKEYRDQKKEGEREARMDALEKTEDERKKEVKKERIQRQKLVNEYDAYLAKVRMEATEAHRLQEEKEALEQKQEEARIHKRQSILQAQAWRKIQIQHQQQLWEAFHRQQKMMFGTHIGGQVYFPQQRQQHYQQCQQQEDFPLQQEHVQNGAYRQPQGHPEQNEYQQQQACPHPDAYNPSHGHPQQQVHPHQEAYHQPHVQSFPPSPYKQQHQTNGLPQPFPSPHPFRFSQQPALPPQQPFYPQQQQQMTNERAQTIQAEQDAKDEDEAQHMKGTELLEFPTANGFEHFDFGEFVHDDFKE